MVESMEARVSEELRRRAIRIRGVVQGVGFRPAMYRLADTLGLTGFVRNDREGVWLEIEGTAATIHRFLDELRGAAPPASRIDQIESADVPPRREAGFRITESPEATPGDRAAAAAIPADLAPCRDCLRELTDPTNRRYRYPFINCTACGPRFTIVRDVPYDRAKTTMAVFTMCRTCRREYDDPRDRRFHAEPNACGACGPKAALVAGQHTLSTGRTAVSDAAAAIADGKIVAIKGAGGFVLAVSAASEAAVARLRARKHRPHKPFAVMARSLEALAAIADLDDIAQEAVTSPVRPIVLVPVRGGVLAPSVAPGLRDIGVYLPPTPLQHLLLAEGPPFQVMTSGNLADEPIARTSAEAYARLAAVADLFLVHDREVHARADDSVVRTARRHPIPIRRARGIVPEAIALPIEGPPVLAVGAHERSTVCLVHAGQALMSQHIGDLDHPDTVAFFGEAIARVCELAGVKPELVVHDLHADYRSTRWALASGLPRMAVQHHHAHVAACLAENGRTKRVTGVAFDGTGLGEDGSLWGGEFLHADLTTSRRLGHLRPIALIGGEAAIREPWRIALAALVDAGEPLDRAHGLLGGVKERLVERARAVLDAKLAPRATGAGRWFDAVAVLCGVASSVSYDGQAAAELEALAGTEVGPPLELGFIEGAPFEIDLRPTIREICHERRHGTPGAKIAARFHATLASAIHQTCRRIGTPAIALTGGCFQNRRLLESTMDLLQADGFHVLTHRRVPSNDGGLALGQAAIALSRVRSTACV